MNIEVISASAGSGKTTTLANLMLEAISGGRVRPGAVLCTTFTNKAAAELQARVRGRLLEAGRVQDADALSSSRIGTVNSVCGQLATEFALELGLSPELRVLDEPGAATLLSQSLSRVVTASEREQLAAIQSRFPQSRFASFAWQDEVRKAVSLARQNIISPEALEQSAESSATRVARLLEPKVESGDVLDAALRAGIEHFLKNGPLGGRVGNATRELLHNAQHALRILRRGETPPWPVWLRLQKAPNVPAQAAAAPLREAAAAQARHPQLHADLHAAAELVLRLAARTLDAYDRAKKERGVLDFIDQEVWAYTLLGREEIRARLAGTMDLVLVDEFQDTSPLQLAIFLRLAALAKRSVWVGDQKQSIYGFRGADPALMDAVLERIYGGQAPTTLGISYRSRPELVRVTSEVFARAFPSQGIPEDRVRLEPRSPDEPAGLGPCFESWSLSGNKAQAAQALAQGIVELLADPAVRVRDRQTGESRPVRGSDVAALCYTNQEALAVADALETLGTRAVVPRAGLLGTLEGRVALAGLKYFVDPYDTLAVAELARLIEYPDRGDAFLGDLLAQPGRDAFRSRPYVTALHDRARALPCAGARVAFDAVCEALDLRERCLRWGDADVRLKNLDALRGLVAAFADGTSDGPATSAAGLVSHLDALADAGEDGQAAEGGDDAVVVSTWHAAKGLEWPVTILSGTPPDPLAVGLCVEAPEGAVSLEEPLRGRSLRYWPSPYWPGSKPPYIQRLTESQEQKREQASRARQDLRLLYVGWTRARDRLVLAAKGGGHTLPLLKRLSQDGTPLFTADGGVLELAGVPVECRMRELEPGAPVERSRRRVAAPVPSGPRDHAPASTPPSEADGLGDIGEPTSLGERTPLSGEPDMAALGDALHGFFASDRPERTREDRVARAQALLRGWGVAQAFPAGEAVAMSDRLHAWVEAHYPGATWRAEWPIFHRLPSGSVVRGSVDLLLETPEGLVVIDHKSYPGNRAQSLERAKTHCGQLARYAEALAAAMKKPVIATYLHLPLAGFMVPVRNARVLETTSTAAATAAGAQP